MTEAESIAADDRLSEWFADKEFTDKQQEEKRKRYSDFYVQVLTRMLSAQGKVDVFVIETTTEGEYLIAVADAIDTFKVYVPIVSISSHLVKGPVKINNEQVGDHVHIRLTWPRQGHY